MCLLLDLTNGRLEQKHHVPTQAILCYSPTPLVCKLLVSLQFSLVHDDHLNTLLSPFVVFVMVLSS